MSKRYDELAYRHKTLLMQCDAQREELADAAEAVESHLGGVDRAVSIVRGIMQRPLLVAGGIAVLLLTGRKRIVRWVSRGALLLSTVKRVQRLLR